MPNVNLNLLNEDNEIDASERNNRRTRPTQKPRKAPKLEKEYLSDEELETIEGRVLSGASNINIKPVNDRAEELKESVMNKNKNNNPAVSAATKATRRRKAEEVVVDVDAVEVEKEEVKETVTLTESVIIGESEKVAETEQVQEDVVVPEDVETTVLADEGSSTEPIEEVEEEMVKTTETRVDIFAVFDGLDVNTDEPVDERITFPTRISPDTAWPFENKVSRAVGVVAIEQRTLKVSEPFKNCCFLESAPARGFFSGLMDVINPEDKLFEFEHRRVLVNDAADPTDRLVALHLYQTWMRDCFGFLVYSVSGLKSASYFKFGKENFVLIIEEQVDDAPTKFRIDVTSEELKEKVSKDLDIKNLRNISINEFIAAIEYGVRNAYRE